jgi:hypothetical protein
MHTSVQTAGNDFALSPKLSKIAELTLTVEKIGVIIKGLGDRDHYVPARHQETPCMSSVT